MATYEKYPVNAQYPLLLLHLVIIIGSFITKVFFKILSFGHHTQLFLCFDDPA